MNAAQLAVADFVQRHGLEADVEHRLLDLVSEVGELAKEVLKSTQYGRVPATLAPNWQTELGDVLFSFLCLGNATEVDMDSALHEALEKYEQRLAARGSAGSS